MVRLVKVRITCEQCGAAAMYERGHVNRSRRNGLRLFCTRACAGVARRTNKTKAQLVAEKKAYDLARRSGELREQLLQEKRSYHARTYDPDKARIKRAERMPLHVEYCRRPEYRAKKANYDRRYRADREFGEFGDAFLLLQDIEREVSARMTRYEIYSANGLLNKRNNRRKAYENPLGF